MSTAPTYRLQRTLTRLERHEEDEPDTRPLDMGLIVRLLGYTRPYATKRNWLFFMVILRSIQMPAITWLIAAVIRGPIANGDTHGVVVGSIAFLALAASTQVVMHFRQRLALELGEAVVFDLRNAMFARLQALPMSFFNRTKLGRIISRMSSDVEDVRVGIQEVLFVTLVLLGQMSVAAAFMLWYDPTLFLMVLGLVPVLWVINYHFRRRMSTRLRLLRESFSRVTATLAESVNGIRVTQSFVRQDVNAQMFGELINDHAQYNSTVNRTQGFFLPLLDLNNQFFVAALLVVGGWQVLRPGATTDVGNLVGFLFMSTVFLGPITMLGHQYNQALTAMAGAERVFTLLDTPADWTEPETAMALEPIRGKIEFRGLSFGYDP
ncbi:MAG TPA: ABC transporter ATP-binding protein, partial [Pirellulales bacterium]